MVLMLSFIIIYLIYFIKLSYILIRKKKKLNEKYIKFEFKLKQNSTCKIEFYLVKRVGTFQILVNNNITNQGLLRGNVVMSYIDDLKKEAIFIMIEPKKPRNLFPAFRGYRYMVFIKGKLKYTFED